MKGSIVKIRHNAVIAKASTNDKEVRLAMSEMLSYKVAGVEHSSAFASGGWDGYSSFYEMRTDSFPAGFVRFLKKKLELRGVRVQVSRAPVPEPLGPENPVVDPFGNDPRYDYQMETVRRLVSLKAMIAQIATGGGKSRIFKLACARINRPTLFVTTRKSLMYQMAEQMGAMGRPIGLIGDGHWSPTETGVNFAIVDSITSRLEIPSFEKEVAAQVEKIEDEVERVFQAVAKKKDLNISSNMLKHAPQELRDRVSLLRQSVSDKIWAKYPKAEMEQSIKSKIQTQLDRRAEMIAFLKKMEFVTIEEAHEVSGNGFYDLLTQCINAVYRLALTATPFMKDAEEANMRLMAVTGPIGIKVTEKMLIERGILAKPHFYYHEPKKPDRLFRSTGWQNAYKIGVVEAVDRNMFIMNESVRASKHGLPVMILVQHTNHGKRLEKLLTTVGGLSTEFISGNDNQSVRQAALNRLKDGHIQVLIGSTILDVGVDVPAVGLVVLAGGGKAEVALRQRIGRGLRAKKSGPNVCFIIDFMDRHNSHLMKHSITRRDIVLETPGFAENILTEPFNYASFGIKQVR